MTTSGFGLSKRLLSWSCSWLSFAVLASVWANLATSAVAVKLLVMAPLLARKLSLKSALQTRMASVLSMIPLPYEGNPGLFSSDLRSLCFFGLLFWLLLSVEKTGGVILFYPPKFFFFLIFSLCTLFVAFIILSWIAQKQYDSIWPSV